MEERRDVLETIPSQAGRGWPAHVTGKADPAEKLERSRPVGLFFPGQDKPPPHGFKMIQPFNQAHSELLAARNLRRGPCLRRGELGNFFCRPAAMAPHSNCAWFLPCATMRYQRFISSLSRFCSSICHDRFRLLKSPSIALEPCSDDGTACATREHSRRHRRSRARSQGISAAPEVRRLSDQLPSLHHCCNAVAEAAVRLESMLLIRGAAAVLNRLGL